MQRHDQIEIALFSTLAGKWQQRVLMKAVIAGKNPSFIRQRNPDIIRIYRFISSPLFSFRHMLQFFIIIFNTPAHAQIKIIWSEKLNILLRTLLKILKSFQPGKFRRTTF